MSFAVAERSRHPVGRRLIVSLHDVGPATLGDCRAWLDDLAPYRLSLTLLVVPGRYRDHRFVPGDPTSRWLAALADDGHEVALHGYDHVESPEITGPRRAAARLAARGAAEFAWLDAAEAGRRLDLGLDVLARAGLRPSTFVAPGWLASQGTERALVSRGFDVLARATSVVDLRLGVDHRAIAWSHRPGGRAEALGRGAVGQLGRRRSGAGAVRIALHPDDRHRPGLVDTSIEAIERLLAQGCRPTTYRGFVLGRRRSARFAV